MKKILIIVFLITMGLLVDYSLKQKAAVRKLNTQITELNRQLSVLKDEYDNVSNSRQIAQERFDTMVAQLKQITEKKEELESQLEEASELLKGLDKERNLPAASRQTIEELNNPEIAGGLSVNLSGKATLKGEIKYLDKSVTKTTKVTPVVIVKDLSSGKNVDVKIKLNGSKYKIEKLPLGSYEISVTVDMDKGNEAGLPGDLNATQRINLTENGKTVEQDISLLYIMHLTGPVDNLPIHSGDIDRYSSPVVFTWIPVPQATSYIYQMSKLKKGQKRSPPFFTDRTGDSKARITLEPTAADEVYVFKVDAYRDPNKIGTLEVRGKDFLIKEYYFSVE